MTQERDILPKSEEIGDLDRAVGYMLDKDKGNKINDAEDKLGALEDLLQDLIKNKNNALEKLSNLKNSVNDAKRSGRND
jgi:predicted transcriptional regulator